MELLSSTAAAAVATLRHSDALAIRLGVSTCMVEPTLPTQVTWKSAVGDLCILSFGGYFHPATCKGSMGFVMRDVFARLTAICATLLSLASVNEGEWRELWFDLRIVIQYIHASKLQIQDDSFVVIQEVTRGLWDDDLLTHDVKSLMEMLTDCESECYLLAS